VQAQILTFLLKNYRRWDDEYNDDLHLKITATFDAVTGQNGTQLECGPMPNLMVALPNTGGALCSTPQSLADAHY